jgi:hypothetical protein
MVARHEVPGLAMQRRPVPEGRSRSLSVPEIFVVEIELMPLQKRPGTPVEKLGSGSIVPLGRGYFTHAVPPGQKPSPHRSSSQLS